MISDLILYLHVLSNLKLDKNTSIFVGLFIGKVKCTEQNSEALNKPCDILTISVLKRLCIVNLLMGQKLNNHELFSDKLKDSSVDWFRVLFVKPKQIRRVWQCASSLFLWVVTFQVF